MADTEVHEKILHNRAVPYGYRISWLANFYRGPVYKRIQRDFGLTSPDFLVLFCLANENDLKAQDICLTTGRPRNSISRAVNSLLDRAMIERETGDDRRTGILHITRAGRKVYEQILPLFVERQNEMLSVLTPRELQTLDGLLTKLVNRSDAWASPY